MERLSLGSMAEDVLDGMSEIAEVAIETTQDFKDLMFDGLKFAIRHIRGGAWGELADDLDLPVQIHETKF